MGRYERATRRIPGVAREDSDDELGDQDLPWEWVYAAAAGGESQDGGASTPSSSRKRKTMHQPRIIGARLGEFQCRVGDTVLLKAEGSNEAWVAIICEFIDADDGGMAANFMWFSTEKEIRNRDKKRLDFYANELYISPSWDINPLESINGKAIVSSLAAFQKRHPTGRIARSSPDFGKTFICRRACNTRTATYSDEFVWEDMYRGSDDDVFGLIEAVKTLTKTSRGRQPAKAPSPDQDFVEQIDGDGAGCRTPSKTPAKARGTPRNRKQPNLTPSQSRVLKKKHLEFTPLATRRLPPSHLDSSPFQMARSQLHVASVPTSLPCREAEFTKVYLPLEAAISDGTGMCIYISGTPGTGKTATVREVVSRLEDAVRSDELDDFIFVEINGMKVTDPHQSYSLLWDALRGERVSPSQALDLLEHEFSHPSPRRVPCVVLMDELDQLVTKNQSVMYNFFNWPSLPHSRLIVLAVANTMDLPERTLSNKISSRLGLTRVTFPGYNHEQLMKIIQSRLDGVPGNIVEPDAVQFASRKVAAVSGDARRALDICRRAVELAEADQRETVSSIGNSSVSAKVTISTIKRAINEATTTPLQQHIRSLPFAAKLLLAAMAMTIRRTGLAEIILGDAMDEMARLLAAGLGNFDEVVLDSLDTFGGPGDGNGKREIGIVDCLQPTAAALDLMETGVVLLEAHRSDRRCKMRFTVGEDEIRMAIRDEPDLKALGVVL